jgi:hypothetical protein
MEWAWPAMPTGFPDLYVMQYPRAILCPKSRIRRARNREGAAAFDQMSACQAINAGNCVTAFTHRVIVFTACAPKSS